MVFFNKINKKKICKPEKGVSHYLSKIIVANRKLLASQRNRLAFLFFVEAFQKCFLFKSICHCRWLISLISRKAVFFGPTTYGISLVGGGGYWFWVFLKKMILFLEKQYKHMHLYTQLIAVTVKCNLKKFDHLTFQFFLTTFLIFPPIQLELNFGYWRQTYHII